MSKREKIIALFALVAVLIGVYQLFLSSPSSKEPVDVKKIKNQMNELVVSVTAELAKDAVKKSDFFVIASAEGKWGSDPFLNTEAVERAELETKKEEEVKFPVFNYTGYLSVGRRVIAIIDGLEYEPGEELEPGGFILLDVDPDKLLIGAKGRQQQISVPMAEEIL